ncbi:MAG: hypothetical protein AAB459_00490 [Patescibacteria group bacterium]
MSELNSEIVPAEILTLADGIASSIDAYVFARKGLNRFVEAWQCSRDTAVDMALTGAKNGITVGYEAGYQAGQAAVVEYFKSLGELGG